MYGNGVMTGMEVIAAVRRQTLQDHHLALSACLVAVAGTAAPGTAVCRFVSATTQTTGTSTTVSASSFRNYNYNPSFYTKLKNRASLME